MKFSILIIDDELEMCLSLKELLVNNGFEAFYTVKPENALETISQNSTDLVIMDLKMPRLSGINMLITIKEQAPDLPVIMITGFPSIENAVRAMKYGALNFYTKPLKLKKLIIEIKELAARKGGKKNGGTHRLEINMLTCDNKMKSIITNLKIAAQTEAPVLITGETGTGKELAANILHFNSLRSKKPFIKVNCAAIPENLLESELFGYEKGAFTDAKTQRKGKFEQADGGTVFLDEIGDMHINTQAKILRILQEKEFERIGGSHIIKTDIRIIAATNKDIQKNIRKGGFREDLYYRLSVIPIHLPPLRERREDILFLAEHFINFFNHCYNKKIKGLDDTVREILLKHNWPGNIREIKNFFERAVIFCNKDYITLADLPFQYNNVLDNIDLKDSVNKINRETILDALNKTKWVKQKAAKLLKIDRKTLYNKMKKLGL